MPTQRELIAQATLAPNALFESYRAMAELLSDVLECKYANREARAEARVVLVRLATALDDITNA
jgi:hypothetical protein